jgi:hypothetical protein
MELLNFTKMTAGFTVGLRPDAREVLVVAVKGTFTIPTKGQELQLADEQLPLVDADTFSGEPGFSAPIDEADYAPFKPRCDVLLRGSAYAPGGRPAQRVPVALRVGALAKTFNVVGPRVWTRGMAALTPSEPEFFTVMPISYDNAFGGIDASDPDKPRYFAANHAGKGFHVHLDLNRVVGQPLPNTEEIDNPVTNPRASYRPMAFGPIGRSWDPRPKYAGTYDKDWQENVFPFLPHDFQEEYYQSAPPDQQMPCLAGGEQVSLHNLTAEGRVDFMLPRLALPISVHRRDNASIDGELLAVNIDTIRLESDARRFSLVWRAHCPLKQNLFEISSVVVGTMPRAMRLAAETGRTYYRSLGELTAAQ